MSKLTPEQFLEVELQTGISADNPAFVRLADATASAVNAIKLPIRTVLDYGAGTGVYADAFHRAGYDVKYFDIWKPHFSYIAQKFPHLVGTHTPITTDLMLFIEVAEHMTNAQIKSLFKQVEPTYILFSSTPHNAPNDIEWGHINVKPEGKWLALFDQLGYALNRRMNLPTEWALLLAKK